ncbi:DNA helicase-2/ATP-dependent DNA helicase PcrA [Paenibacillus turicensis]|uniref:DNA helicase-2/ATP-dependent DNA helicase PcrA n=2 Tax=Paenibacillus turicensis TaxID=160487 RepID=A0ABS4FQM2_9BACL|nr:DNA helicase-2/ATP-dependent DNA helicase PcrA [Paenibacillus turicensis]
MADFQSAYQEEKEKLTQTMEMMDTQLSSLRSIPEYTGSDFTQQVLEDMRQQQMKQLELSAKEPYFGRLDFETDREGLHPYYIGKRGVNDPQSNQPLVLDWRAPLASLFYSFTGGEVASYEAPEGEINGSVHLKRNIIVRKGELERIADTFNRDSEAPAVSDEFLVYRLGENKDNRLRDIVSTIQAEQDLIIRGPRNAALIIQGVAGSGKTTVALHRLAFLLYQYKEQMSAEKMMIFAPNMMFIDYISEVLPELGVGDIGQGTFMDWASQLLELDEVAVDDSSVWTNWFDQNHVKHERGDEQLSGRFKGSIQFKNLIDEAIVSLDTLCVPKLSFEPWDGAVLSYEEIVAWFEGEYRHYPIAKRKERVLARIHRWIEMELKKSMSANELKERKKKAQQREKAYAKKWPELTPLAIYQELFGVKKGVKLGLPQLKSGIPAEIWKQTQGNLKGNVIKEEDLAPMLHLYTKLNEITSAQTFDHIVIDEAQDFSPFQIAVLDQFVKGHSFTILGDLSQGIHYYKGIQSWEEMSSLFQPEETSYFALKRSYRSTMEIIDYGNHILQSGVKTDLLAIPVFRSGNPVLLKPIEVKAVQAQVLANLQQLMSGDYRTAAILTRTLAEARSLYSFLIDSRIEVNLIDGDRGEYRGGISVLPVYLSKGLEFDAVIVTDVDTAHYSEQDAKLLYVGCTRALHELWILHGKQVPSYVHIPA